MPVVVASVVAAVAVAEGAADATASRSEGTRDDPVCCLIAGNVVARLVRGPGKIWDDDGIFLSFLLSLSSSLF